MLARGGVAGVQGGHGGAGAVADLQADVRGRAIDPVADADRRAVKGEVAVLDHHLLVDQGERRHLLRAGLGRGQPVHGVVEVEQLFQLAVLGQLGGELGGVRGVERILVLQLGDQQGEELVLAQRVFGFGGGGGRAGGGGVQGGNRVHDRSPLFRRRRSARRPARLPAVPSPVRTGPGPTAGSRSTGPGRAGGGGGCRGSAGCRRGHRRPGSPRPAAG